MVAWPPTDLIKSVLTIGLAFMVVGSVVVGSVVVGSLVVGAAVVGVAAISGVVATGCVMEKVILLLVRVWCDSEVRRHEIVKLSSLELRDGHTTTMTSGNLRKAAMPFTLRNSKVLSAKEATILWFTFCS